MSKILKILTLLLVFVFLSCAGFIFYIHSKDQKLASPIFKISKNMKIADNVWFPNEQILKTAEANEIDITAKSAFFVDTATGEVLYEKNPREKLSIASLNKIMTAIITLENRSLEDKVYISERASLMEPDEMILMPNERLTIKELLEGIFLVSANDAAEALAEGVTGRRDEFINLMNAKAKMLGMNDTLFLNPSGLEEDFAKQYSTAYDVALMSRYAVKNWPVLVEISSKPYVFIPATSEHQSYEMYSGINLLTSYQGVVGFKTGFTPEAGLTLVTLARRDGKEVLGVLLGSTNRRDDAKLLLDYSFKKLGVKVEEN